MPDFELPAIPDHTHAFDGNGRPTCGCMRPAALVSLNGVDLSQFVERVDWDAALPGLTTTGPIAVTGTWDDGRETCITCQQRFTPGPEGTAYAVEAISGRRLGPICPACGTALVSPDA